MAPANVQENARRQLAVLLGQDGAASKAMVLLDANRDTMADRRVRLFLRSLDPAARLQAIDQFQASLRDEPGTPEDRLLLAAMYEAAGQFGQARTLLAELSTQDPREARYLYRNASLLIRMDDVDEAERALKRLHDLEPNSHRVREVRAAIVQAKQK
jgi:thioredoxin-like negative regulator of GroEL